jgi:hypothetical protein
VAALAAEIIDIQDDTDQLQGCAPSPLCAGDAPEQPQSHETTDKRFAAQGRCMSGPALTRLSVVMARRVEGKGGG